MKRLLVNRDGFSLVELFVALCLLSIGIFAVISMQVTGIRSNSIANRLSSANALAQEVMDDVMSWDVADSRVNTATADAVYDLNGPNNAGTDITVTGAGTFRASYTTVLNTPVAGTTQVTVNVYRVINGVADARPLTTLTGCKRVT